MVTVVLCALCQQAQLAWIRTVVEQQRIQGGQHGRAASLEVEHRLQQQRRRCRIGSRMAAARGTHSTFCVEVIMCKGFIEQAEGSVWVAHACAPRNLPREIAVGLNCFSGLHWFERVHRAE
eukprot:scaffold109854_cov22-Tisochrysis_lutea.AAC.1